MGSAALFFLVGLVFDFSVDLGAGVSGHPDFVARNLLLHLMRHESKTVVDIRRLLCTCFKELHP